MVSPKFLILAVVLIGAHSRQIYLDHYPVYPSLYADDSSNILQDDWEDSMLQSAHPRFTRQLHGVLSSNPDGTMNLNAKLPLAGGDSNVLSAVAGGSALRPGGGYGAATGGLQLENVNGHSLSLTKTHIPTFGDQLTAAGKVNLLHTDRHNLDANAFVTRNMPKFPNVPNFNTHGGSVDYMFNNKAGVSLGVAQTPLLQKTDYSALGNLNLFRDRASSLDLSAGASRSVSPFIPKSNWQPTFGLTFSRGF